MFNLGKSDIPFFHLVIIQTSIDPTDQCTDNLLNKGKN